MNRVRVSELAKELGLETKAILAQFNKLGIQVKNHLSMVSDGDVSKLKAALHHTNKTNNEKESAQKATNKIFIRRKVADTIPTTQDISLSKPDEISNQEQSVYQSNVMADDVETKEAVSHLASESMAAESYTQYATENKTVQHTDHLDQVVPFNVEIKSHETSSALKSDTTATQKITAPEFQEPMPSAHVVHKEISQNEKTSQSAKIDDGMPLQTTARVQPRIPSPMSAMPQRPQTFTQKNTSSFQQKPSTETTQSPRSTLTQTSPRPTSSFTGATIVRRAAETSNVYQVKMSRPHSGSDTYQPSYGPRRPSSPDGRFPPRPAGGGAPGSQNAGRFQQKSFVMPDSLPATTIKDSTSLRTKDHKDRDKRRSLEDIERSNKNLRAKGARFYEDNQYIDELNFNLESGETAPESAINVRTMTASKKRKSSSFKRKERIDTQISNPTKASKKIIRIDSHISVNDLASELSQKSGVIIKTLLKLGMFATANKVLDFDTATLVAQEFGYETQNVSVSLEDIISQKNTKQQTTVLIETRPPIITIMGHVDHGKTSLLDALRQTNVAAGEAGGITQHIGAYQIEYQNRKLTFLDTPGHEAFTAMRARGAQVTDIVVLVVAADDGVMPQTIEAIAHAKAANVPLIVAINKIDKPGINTDRIIRELSEHGVISEEWGGDSMFIQVSAKTHKGLDQLIEAILLQADVLDLKAPANGFAEGIVIEARRDKFRGPVATVIVTKGVLKQQDSVVIGKTMGRVRAMYSDSGALLKEAIPGTPVELIGLDDVPDAGDVFNAVASDAIAREAVAYRLEKHRQAILASQKPTSTNDLMALFAQKDSAKKTNELSIIIKADTHGSAEAIKTALQKLDTEKVKTKVVLAAVGGITETDIVLADASRALVLGFNVRPDKIASQRAEACGIKIMFFNIIYEMIEAVKVAMAGTLAPIKQDKIIGHAEVRNLFTVPKVGVIAGCFITDGKITRPCRLRVVRDGIVQYTGQLGSLKRFKEDAKEVMHGFECGIGVENYNDLKVGDVLEAYVIEEIAAEL